MDYDLVCSNHLEELYEGRRIEGKAQVDEEFSNVLSDFRLKIANDILRRNPSIISSNSLLNYYTQIILDRIIFENETVLYYYDADDVTTIKTSFENCSSDGYFAKLISSQNDKVSKAFYKKYKGEKIKFKGSIDFIDKYKDYDTRYTVLASAWDYSADSQKGPTFKFENVGVYELGKGIYTGANVTIKATVDGYNEDTGIIYLNSIEIKKR